MLSFHAKNFYFEMIFSIKTNLRRGFTIPAEHYLQVLEVGRISYIFQLNLENVNEQR